MADRPESEGEKFDRMLSLVEKDKNTKALIVEIDSPAGR